jgi:hypothetical protein
LKSNFAVAPSSDVALRDQLTIPHQCPDSRSYQTISLFTIRQFVAETLRRPGDDHCHLFPMNLGDPKDGFVNGGFDI